MNDMNAGSDSGPSVEQMLRMGIDTAKNGNKDGARVMLRQVLQRDRRNDRAWTWLAYVEDDPVQRRRYLQNAVRINPENKTAQKALDKLKKSRTQTENKTMLYGSIALGGLIIVSILACVIVLALN